MKRRTTLKLGLAAAAAGTAAGTLAPAASRAGSHAKTAFVLAHGSWHGAWCWGLVEPKPQPRRVPVDPHRLPGPTASMR